MTTPEKNFPQKKNIDYFTIEGTPGGNQEWCTDFWMHLGGCGALAACDLCICLARNYQLSGCYPHDARNLTKKDYVNFSMKMKPYIRPRIGGVTKLSIFTNGCERYLRVQGYRATFATCDGDESYERACAFVRRSLDKNLPVAYLMLRHQNLKFKDLDWHWFSVTGYELRRGRIFLVYHTYGERLLVDFEELWDTGMQKKGGLVALQNIEKI